MNAMDGFGYGDDRCKRVMFSGFCGRFQGYWAVKRAVGTTACLLGKALTCRYLRQDNFLEVRSWQMPSYPVFLTCTSACWLRWMEGAGGGGWECRWMWTLDLRPLRVG